jgi:hypothetical protein
MKKRSTWQGVIISPDAKLGPDGEGQYPVISFAWYPEYGYEVHCMELTAQSHFLATMSKLSKPEVYVELGGQGQELWPPQLFVPLALASQALQHLLRTGTRDASLSWIAIDAFPRRTVKARSARPKS